MPTKAYGNTQDENWPKILATSTSPIFHKLTSAAKKLAKYAPFKTILRPYYQSSVRTWSLRSSLQKDIARGLFIHPMCSPCWRRAIGVFSVLVFPRQALRKTILNKTQRTKRQNVKALIEAWHAIRLPSLIFHVPSPVRKPPPVAIIRRYLLFLGGHEQSAASRMQKTGMM